MINCVVFDFDGTLVDSNDLKRLACFEIVVDHPGGPRELESVLEEVPGDRARIFATYAERMSARGLELDPTALTESYTRLVDRRVMEAPEMPGAKRLIAHLKALDLRLYLSSSTPEANLLTIVEGRGWSDWFRGIHGYPKQKGDTLREILGDEGLTPAEVAVVGDGLDDERSAAAVGCRFIPVGAGSYSFEPGNRTYELEEVPTQMGIDPGGSAP